MGCQVLHIRVVRGPAHLLGSHFAPKRGPTIACSGARTIGLFGYYRLDRVRPLMRGVRGRILLLISGAYL